MYYEALCMPWQNQADAGPGECTKCMPLQTARKHGPLLAPTCLIWRSMAGAVLREAHGAASRQIQCKLQSEICTDLPSALAAASHGGCRVSQTAETALAMKEPSSASGRCGQVLDRGQHMALPVHRSDQSCRADLFALSYQARMLRRCTEAAWSRSDSCWTSTVSAPRVG